MFMQVADEFNIAAGRIIINGKVFFNVVVKTHNTLANACILTCTLNNVWVTKWS